MSELDQYHQLIHQNVFISYIAPSNYKYGKLEFIIKYHPC